MEENERTEEKAAVTPPGAGGASASLGGGNSAPGSRRKRTLVLGGIVLVAGAAFGIVHFIHSLHYESTDDAFIDGHIVQMSPQISGTVLRVLIDDNEEVKTGDLLIEIDPAQYEARVANARAALDVAQTRERAALFTLALTRITASAELDLAQAGVQTAEAQLASARSRLAQFEAQVAAAEADLEQERASTAAASAEAHLADLELQRARELRHQNVSSQQDLDLAEAKARSANADLDAARQKISSSLADLNDARAARQAAEDEIRQAEAGVGEARARLASAQSAPERVSVSEAQWHTSQAEVEQARAVLRQAELDLSYTRITAPQGGRVTRKQVEVGDYLQPGQAIFALVPDEVWVTANFKETQLTRMRPGQSVTIEVDAYPGVVFHGHVDSIQTGTGARFSLFPPENATGNFVKVVQRVPVKIVFDEDPAPQHFLAPGMSVVPHVRVR